MFGRYVYHLYFARFLAGCTGGGLFVCIPLFVAEIAEDRCDKIVLFYTIALFNINILGYVVRLGHYCSYAQILAF